MQVTACRGTKNLLCYLGSYIKRGEQHLSVVNTFTAAKCCGIVFALMKKYESKSGLLLVSYCIHRCVLYLVFFSPDKIIFRKQGLFLPYLLKYNFILSSGDHNLKGLFLLGCVNRSFFFKVLLLLPPVDIFLWSNGDMFLISHVRAREKFEQVVIPDGNIKTINQAIEKYFFLFLKCF